jgi:hypothetical protein
MGFEKRERRNYPRAPLRIHVDVLHGKNAIVGHPTIDVSEGGIRLGFVGVPTEGKLKLLLPLPFGPSETRRHCMIDGQVAWRTLKSTGVRFIDPPEEMLSHLREYVVEHGTFAS